MFLNTHHMGVHRNACRHLAWLHSSLIMAVIGLLMPRVEIQQ